MRGPCPATARQLIARTITHRAGASVSVAKITRVRITSKFDINTACQMKSGLPKKVELRIFHRGDPPLVSQMAFYLEEPGLPETGLKSVAHGRLTTRRNVAGIGVVTKVRHLLMSAGKNFGFVNSDLISLVGIPTIVFVWEERPFGHHPAVTVSLDARYLHQINWPEAEYLYEHAIEDPRGAPLVSNIGAVKSISPSAASSVGGKQNVMRTIVLATQKGGSGKSTLAIGLAVAAMGCGHRVAIIETDQQGTVSNWGRRRALPEPRIDRIGGVVEIEQALRMLKNSGFTLVVIDTPATNNYLSSCAISAADMCLIPVRPSPADVEAALPTLGIVRKFGKQFAFILNQAPPLGSRLSEAAAALNATGILAQPFIVQRNDHQDALGVGFAVTEFAPDGKAAQEIRTLWRWIWVKLTAESIDRKPSIRAIA